MKEEVEKLKSSVKEPTYYSKYQQAQNYSSWTNSLRIDDEASRLLERQRAKMGMVAQEAV